MDAIITRRNFMRGAGVAALAAGSAMLTGCGLVDSVVDNIISGSYDDDINLGKYTVAGANVRKNDISENGTAGAIVISFDVNNAKDLAGKSSTEFISDITIDGTAVSSVAASQTVEVESETVFGTTVSAARIRATYKISARQSAALFENGKELKFTVTMPHAGSAVYTLTYDASKEGSDSGPVTSKVSRK